MGRGCWAVVMLVKTAMAQRKVARFSEGTGMQLVSGAKLTRTGGGTPSPPYLLSQSLVRKRVKSGLRSGSGLDWSGLVRTWLGSGRVPVRAQFMAGFQRRAGGSGSGRWVGAGRVGTTDW